MLDDKSHFEDISLLLKSKKNDTRIALSKRYPHFKNIILHIRYIKKYIENFKKYPLSSLKSPLLTYTLTRHQSVLRRKLGDSDPRLQEQKIINIALSVNKLNGLVINPGETFSFWHVIGRPTVSRGFVGGMLLSDGKIVEGIGGGMCQMSNFLYWMFLHSDLTIIERHHHSRDVFPDSGRILPFGSGATIMYNFVDLQVKNTTRSPIQIHLWLTATHLKGQLRCDSRSDKKYHVYQKKHCFVKYEDEWYRFNEIWRDISVNGEIILQERVTCNFAPVLYQITENYLKENFDSRETC